MFFGVTLDDSLFSELQWKSHNHPKTAADIPVTRDELEMWQVFCWSARVMGLCISPLPIPRVPDRVRQFANPSLTGSSLSLYSSEVVTRFWEVLTSMPVCC
jgi:hypothetical protein